MLSGTAWCPNRARPRCPLLTQGDPVAHAALVPNRSGSLELPDLSLRTRGNEIVDFLGAQKADTYWLIGNVDFFVGAPNPEKDNKVAMLHLEGRCTVATLNSKVGAIFSTKERDLPAVWMMFDVSEAKADSVGNFEFRDEWYERILLELPGAFMFLQIIGKSDTNQPGENYAVGSEKEFLAMFNPKET
jgi:hypothetical protein